MHQRSVTLIAISALMACFASLATLLHFITQLSRRQFHLLDDLSLAIALTLSLGICACNIVGAACFRFGDHEIYNTSGPEEGFPLAWLLLGYGKIFYVLQLLHCCAMSLIKGSFLFFLHRTFGVSKRFRTAMWCVAAYVISWWFATFWISVLQCWPIQYNWGTSASDFGSCLPKFKLFYALTALLNTFSDFAVAILPLPEVWRLSMPASKKLWTTLTLLTVLIVIVAGIGRTVSYFQQYYNDTVDYTYENYPYLLWTSIEPCLGVVGVCLPRLRSLATKDGRREIWTSVSETLSSRSLIPFRSAHNLSSGEVEQVHRQLSEEQPRLHTIQGKGA